MVTESQSSVSFCILHAARLCRWVLLHDYAGPCRDNLMFIASSNDQPSECCRIAEREEQKLLPESCYHT